MSTPTIQERIDTVKSDLGITEDVAFGRICGMSKSVVNQLKTGKMKSFAARYAYKLQDRYGYSAKWLQLGEGNKMLSQHHGINEPMVSYGKFDMTELAGYLNELDYEQAEIFIQEIKLAALKYRKKKQDNNPSPAPNMAKQGKLD